MRQGSTAFLLLAFLVLRCDVAAQTVQPLDLGPFAGESGFNTIGADWLLPRGRQVIQGVPFQFAGVIELYGGGSAQAGRPKPTSVDNIPVGRKFEILHLISGTAWSATNGTTVALIRITYADGATANLEVDYRRHTWNYYNYRHKKEPSLLDPLTHVAWTAQAADPARWDKELRLFHAIFANPWPEKEVKSLSLISTKTQAGLIVAAISVGEKDAPLLANTIPDPQFLDDTAKRSGDPVQIEGRVSSYDGKPLSSVRVRVIGTRPFNTSEDESSQDADEHLATMTEAEGRFVLPPVPDNRLYHLSVFAEGFQPAVFQGVDPLRSPVEIRLKTKVRITPKLKSYIWGKLVGPDGNPVTGAIVEPDGIEENRGKSWGGSHGFPDRLFSGSDGEFLMEREKSFTQLCLNIRSHGLAPLKIWLTPTNTPQTLHLMNGAQIVGRIVKEGEPLEKVRTGVCGQDRNSEVFAGHFETFTDERGNFAFKHLPPSTGWYVYGIMDSVKSHGAIPPRPVQSGNDGDTLDLGDVTVVPGTELAGRVKSRSGEKLPAGLKITVGSETAWDSQTLSVDDEGVFAFAGLSKGLITVNMRAEGWKFSGANSSLDDFNPFELVGLLEGNRNDFSLVVERGERVFNSYWNGNGRLPTQDESRNRPLFGSEPGGPPAFTFTGSVIDDKTGAPIQSFAVTPGRKPPVSAAGPTVPKPFVQQLADSFKRKTVPFNERPCWDHVRTEQFTNGQFAISFAPLSGLPLLRIEAAHYLPFETEPVRVGTNLIIRLKAGIGPRGIVQLPNGQLAKGATVLFIGDGEQSGLDGSGILSNYGDKKNLQTTEADGRFDFEPRSNGRVVFIGHAQGWAQIDADEFSNERTVRLKPWAVITGKLVDTNGAPVPDIPLSVAADWNFQRGDPFVNFQPFVTTDSKGQFQLGTIPPGQMFNLVRRINSGGGGWSQSPQTWFVAEPGKTNDLGKIIFDQPPPKPIFDRLKNQLGL